MLVISKLIAVFRLVTNEFTLTIVNFSIDFSLIKVKVLIEFYSLSRGLLEYKRIEAKSRLLYIIARKLGALFNNINY